MLSIVWISLIVISVVYGVISGNIENVVENISIGATESVSLLISICGIMCFWSGIMEVMIKSGLIDKIAKLVSPILKLLFKNSWKDKKARTYISSNFSANLMGLSNAATPMGLKAADRIYEINQRKGTPKELIMLVIINCSSIQLIPTTVSAIRTSYGAESSFDILPAVWITSIISVLGAVLMAKLIQKFERS